MLDSVKSLQTEEEEDDEDGLDEADVLEIMVDKLARIVKNVMSSNFANTIAQNRDLIDESTEQFLNQYSDTTKKDSDIKKTATIREDTINVSTIDLPVSKELICSFDFDALALTHDELVPCALYVGEGCRGRAGGGRGGGARTVNQCRRLPRTVTSTRRPAASPVTPPSSPQLSFSRP